MGLMLGSLIRFSVLNARVITALAVMLMVYAGFAISRAGLDIFPEFSAPRVIVQTETHGLTAEQTETLVTQRIEKVLLGLIGLENLRSESIQGLSVVTAVFRENTDIYRDRQLVGERLATLGAELPKGTATPVMVPLSSSSATLMTLGLSSKNHSLMELRDVVDYSLAPRLMAIQGVADINVFGGEIRQLQIQPDIDRLRQYGLSIQDVLDAAREATGTVGAGFLENDNQRISLEVKGLPATAESLGNVVVYRDQGRHVRLGDIANIQTAPKPAIGAAEIGGEPAIILMVIGQHGSNTLDVSKSLESLLDDYGRLFEKQGIKLYPNLFKPADYIERSLENLSGHLILGGLLVVGVLYLFLANLKIALIPALAIPISLLAGITILLAVGVKLNIMILGGLAIALGEVVDDAIIDTENIFRRIRENRALSRPKATWRVVFQASMEIRSSVTYASFIVALVFTPLLTLEGVAGRLFSPLGYAYIVAILASLAVSLTVTPALCYLIIAQSNPPEPGNSPPEAELPIIRFLQRRYESLLEGFAKAPTQSVLWPLGLSFLLLGLLPTLGGDFLPRLREGHFIVHTTSLPGTSLRESIRAGSQIVKEFLKIPGVESASQWAGRAERGADTYGTHYSEYEIRLEKLNGSDQEEVLGKLRRILEQFPGFLSEANTFLTERIEETLSGYTAPVVINLYGQDLETLDDLAAELSQRVRGIEGAKDVQVRSPATTPLVELQMVLEDLSNSGLRPLELTRIIHTSLKGETVGTYTEDNRSHEVSVILPISEREHIEALERLPLRSADGHYLELGQLTRISQTQGRYNILHRQGQRVQTITANVEGRDLDSFFKELRQKTIGEISFPQGVTPEFTGAALAQSQARMHLMIHALLAGIGVLVLLGLSIGNARNVLLTLVNLPFSLAGGVIAALIIDTSLSIGSMVGFVTLFGITIRNAIMLASHYRHLTEKEQRAWSLETAIWGASQRLPSILMTALVTGLALLPIAIDSDNPGREIMGPMASVIIGGLVSSTLLSLIALPILFARFGRFGAVKR